MPTLAKLREVRHRSLKKKVLFLEKQNIAITYMHFAKTGKVRIKTVFPNRHCFGVLEKNNVFV